MSNIVVIAEQGKDGLKKSAYEVVSEARRLADKQDKNVTVLVFGNVAAEEASALGEYGADRVVLIGDERQERYDSETLRNVVLETVESQSADVVICSASDMGKDLAPRLAAALNAGMASDCIGLHVDESRITAKRALYSGKVFARIDFDSDIVILTLRPNVFEVSKSRAGHKAEVEKAVLPALTKKVEFKELKKTAGDKLNVQDADIIVTGGRGVRSADQFALIEELAAVLGAAVGATRAVVDAGWRPHDEQIGQTGKVVSPKLYFLIGASGSIQHWAGMSGSKCIVAVNKDPDAPIMKRADYSVLGDLFEVVPEMTQALK